jgi:exonuclease SbcD
VDLFDTFNPPVEAIDLLYKTLKRLTNNGKRPVIAMQGITTVQIELIPNL